MCTRRARRALNPRRCPAEPRGGAGLHDPERVAVLPADQCPAAERAARFLGRWRGLKDRLPIARLLNAVFEADGDVTGKVLLTIDRG